MSKKKVLACVVVCNYFVYGINVVHYNLDTGAAQSSLRIFAWLIIQTCLRVLAISSFRKRNENMICFYETAQPLLIFEALCGRWRHVFATSTGRWLNRNWLCHPLALLIVGSMTHSKYV